jgi:hypothetical protein
MIWQSWCPHCKSHWIAPYRQHSLMEKLLTVLILPSLRSGLLQISRDRTLPVSSGTEINWRAQFLFMTGIFTF